MGFWVSLGVSLGFNKWVNAILMIISVSVIICITVILIMTIYCSFMNQIEHLHSALSGKGFKG